MVFITPLSPLILICHNSVTRGNTVKLLKEARL